MTLLGDSDAAPRILVVEDHAALGRFIAAALRSAGWLVSGPIADREQALAAALQLRVDLCLMDRQLRNGEVFAVADALIARRIRCLFVSGHARQTLPERFRTLPFLEKPFTMEELLDAVRAALVAPPPTAPPDRTPYGDEQRG